MSLVRPGSDELRLEVADRLSVRIQEAVERLLEYLPAPIAVEFVQFRELGRRGKLSLCGNEVFRLRFTLQTDEAKAHQHVCVFGHREFVRADSGFV